MATFWDKKRIFNFSTNKWHRTVRTPVLQGINITVQMLTVINFHKPAIYFEIFSEKDLDILGFLLPSRVGEGKS
jgi:hypothetical protein